MCLLVVRWQPDEDYPLVVGANRDERLDRPATALAVLAPVDPRILGGRDHLAGGTWLAVNEHGVVAGLTNQPSVGGRDPSRRSRGELPLQLARAPSAAAAVDALVGSVRPGDYNPVWLVVGDRRDLFFVDLGREPGPGADRLAAGLHVMENRALGIPSAKVDQVVGSVTGATAHGEDLWSVLPRVLADHTLPVDRADEIELPRPPGSAERPPGIRAACVHTDGYGTRSSTLVRVPASKGHRPDVKVASGPPCTTAFVDAGALWGS